MSIFQVVERMAYELFLECGVPMYWTFGFDRGKRRYGQCNYVKKKITVSRYYVENKAVTIDMIRNLILHEIAHVLAGPYEGHGPNWVNIAKKIGCDGKVLIDPVFIPRGHWLACPLGHTRYHYFRRVRLGKWARCRVCNAALEFKKI